MQPQSAGKNLNELQSTWVQWVQTRLDGCTKLCYALSTWNFTQKVGKPRFSFYIDLFGNQVSRFSERNIMSNEFTNCLQ